MGNRKIRVLLAKVGLDGHDRGIKLVARRLMDAGMEVIYTGLRSTPEQVAAAAAQEDVDVLGLSFLAGDHMIQVRKLIDCLKARELDGILLLMGGIVLPGDIPALEKMGVARVFLPGTPLDSIAKFIDDHLKRTAEKEHST